MLKADNVQELWEVCLDLDKVREAIVATGVEEYDADDAERAVKDSVFRWIMDDMRDFEVLGIEEYVEEARFKAYFDMRVRIKDSACKQFQPYVGKTAIIDWKTTRAVLDAKWKNKLIMSQQWRMYGWLSDADIFMYRGIQRTVKESDATGFREVLLEIPAEVKRNAEITIETARFWINSFNRHNFQHSWPKTMPAHCYDFNSECRYLTDCDLERVVDIDVTLPDKTLSYSRIQEFWNCPEKYRRNRLVQLEGYEEDEEDNAYSRLGRAIHAGLAEVYSQVFEVPYEGRKKEETVPYV